MTHPYTKLADAVRSTANGLYMPDSKRRTELLEAARILRAAASVDVDGLMVLHDAASEARHLNGSPLYNVKANDARAALESALRMALAGRDWRSAAARRSQQ